MNNESISENNGLGVLTDADLNVYSVGISTGSVAEMRMLKLNSKRQVIATTIDSEGANFAQEQVDKNGLSKQIIIKIEDISKSLPYKEETFDFIYARLVLHYLPKDNLKQALDELYRILKKGGKLFVVVRSSQCHEATSEKSQFDPSTGFTTYSSGKHSYSRFFHTEKSIQDYLIASKFSIKHTKSYEEQLYVDFQRTKLSSHIDSLIEVLSTK